MEVDRKKTQRLRASSSVLSSIEFAVCPRCLLDVTHEMHQRELYGRCSLCNRPLRDKSDGPPRAMPRLDDLDEQVQEAREVLKDVQREAQVLRRLIQEMRTRETELGRTIDLETQAFVAPMLDRLLDQAHEVALFEAELARVEPLVEQAKYLIELGEKLNEAEQKVVELEKRKSQIDKPDMVQLNELQRAFDQIMRDVDFPQYRTSRIDADSFMPFVNGDFYTSGQGTALKGLATVCYHLALLQLSRIADTYFPKFLVIDSPSTGDLNEENHIKLLKYLAFLQTNGEATEKLDWQIILTTRKVIPELESFVIEQISNADNMRLLRY